MFRTRALVIAVLAFCLPGLPAGSTSRGYAAPATIELVARSAPDAVVRVEAVFEVAGELKFRHEQKLKSMPTSVAARLAYDERRLADSPVARTLRYYRTAEAELHVEKTTTPSKLRDERRLVVAEQTDAQPRLFSPSGCLNSDEAELIQIPANSLLVDRLLPGKSVPVGEPWKHEADLIGALLNVDAVSHADVSSTLAEADAAGARVEMRGVVQGAVGGVAAEFDLVGRYRYDAAQGRITWLAWVLKEKRSIGHVEPGFEITSRLQMRLLPVAAPKELDPAEWPAEALVAIPELLRLEFVSRPGRYRFEHDRRWHVMADRSDVISLRRVDRGELLAQCNITTVPQVDDSRRPTLTQFQDDIRRSLKDQFGQFVRVGESENSLGYTIFRAEAIGTVDELEIVWTYYLIQDPLGRQVVFAFTCEKPLVERFGEADRELVDTVRFLDEQSAAQPTPAPQLR